MISETQKPQTILIVDDSPHNLKVLSELLIQQDFEVLIATDGLMAIEQTEYAHPDLILLDVMMPQISGFETCRRLKAKPGLQEIPIIFMTALIETSDRLQGFAAGGVDYITKPYQAEEVLARIKVHLQLRNLTSALAEKNQQLNEQNERLQKEIWERQQTEIALRESEERFRTMANSAPVLLWVSDAAGQCTFFNDSWLIFTGRSLEQELGEGWATGVHPDDFERCMQIFKKGLVYRQSFRMEYRLRRADGEYRWILDHGAPRCTPDGEFVGFIGSCVDISDRKRAEEDLRQREAQFAAIAANLPGYLYRVVVLPDGTFLMPYLSEGAEQIYGLPVANLTTDQSQMQNLIHPNDRRMMEASIYQSLQTLVASSFEFRVKTRTGGWRWLHGIAQVHRTNDNRIIFDGICLDINEKKQLELQRQQSEAALRESETRFRQIAEAVQEGFFVAEVIPANAASNDIYQYVYVSPSYEVIMGSSAAEIYANGSRWLNFIHPDDRDRIEAAFQQELQGGVFDEEYRYLRTDGTMRWIRAQAFPLRNEAGALVRVVGTIQDVSDRKQAEAQIRASLNEKEALLAEIHHRVKNNLQIISSLLNLQAYKIEDPQVRKALEDSWTRVDSMALVHETLYRSQDFSSINFAAYMENLAQNLLNTYNTQTEQIHLIVEADPKISLRLNQAIPCGLIINELITNALKHAFKPTLVQPGSRELMVHLAQTPDQHIQLRVGNSGDTLPAHFDLSHTRSMGLQLVTQLVTQLDGNLTIEREHATDGNGSGRTIFQITFDPLQEAE